MADEMSDASAAIEIRWKPPGLLCPMCGGRRYFGGSAEVGFESIRKRVGELVRRGKLVVSGERQCRVSGQRVQAYKVTT